MAANCRIDLGPLVATAQVILNVCSAPMDARRKLACISYASGVLEYLANAGIAELGRGEGAAPPLYPRPHGEESIAAAFAYITRQSRSEVQS